MAFNQRSAKIFRLTMKPQTFLPICLGFSINLVNPRADVLQINVHPLLTGRTVTTFTDGKLVPWTPRRWRAGDMAI